MVVQKVFVPAHLSGNLVPMHLKLANKKQTVDSKSESVGLPSFKTTGANYNGFIGVELNDRIQYELGEWLKEINRQNNFQGPSSQAYSKPTEKISFELLNIEKLLKKLNKDLKRWQECVAIAGLIKTNSGSQYGLEALAITTKKNLDSEGKLRIKYFLLNPSREKSANSSTLKDPGRALVELLSRKSFKERTQGRLIMEPKDPSQALLLERLGFVLQDESMVYIPNSSHQPSLNRNYGNQNFQRERPQVIFKIPESYTNSRFASLKGPYTDGELF